MFDPLSSTAAFGGNDDVPPWPTTPHPQHSPVPNLRRASGTSVPPITPDKGPAPGYHGKDAQIYGQPEAGLISPRDTVGSNGKHYENPSPYLRVRITGLDRNRRDMLIKFDAQTNLSNFTGTTYRNVSRSYQEFQQFYDSIIHSNPQTIVPALPLAQTSAPSDEEDDRLVRIMLQRWMTRICEDPIIINDEDLRSFVESDFGYQPTPRPRKKASTGFSLIRRNVPDEDEELQRARFELTKLEGQFFETAKAVDKLAITRKSLATAHSDMGNKLINVATTEAHPPLGNALNKLGRAWHSLADLDQAQAISECVILGDSLGYQGMNARSAKETLLMRTGVLEEYQAAVKTTISKRRNIERLKASTNIRPERVDEALEDMEEANKYEQVLARRAEGISQNLHQALQTHNRCANDDITSALIEHARSSIMYERQLLRELETLRVDVNSAANKIDRSKMAIPKPSYIPPLEDYSRPPPVPNHTPPVRRTPPPQPHSPANYNAPNRPTASPHTFNSDPLANKPLTPSNSIHGPTSPSSITPLPASPIRSPQPSVQSFPPSPRFAGPTPSSPSPLTTSVNITDADQNAGPPLGGRFADGTQSMIVTSTSTSMASPLHSSTPVTPSSSGDPLMGSSTVGPSSGASLVASRSLNGHGSGNGSDPLGNSRPNSMSQSVRVQPTRPRLDAREAASKLANMF